ncbi:ABC transporter ATP-binding protein [Flavimarina sp. Hel_I_48]|uniref:ABC transporter ATP-binding protein n=1 Tax=Flavimarina sp. Hel_I_48 TaxID=1392488 RepID=UPI0004DF8174|nr:ABC transporter ATP-binding protein [Flavimarina sp. Hel_I_48]
MDKNQHKTPINPVLKTKNLSVGYSPNATQKEIVSGITISFQKGELIGLVGINGSGKSTLLRSLSGLQKPLHGTIFLEGKKLESISAEKRSQLISVVLTGQPISKNLSVAELVALGRQPYTNWLGNLNKNDIKSINNALTATEMQALKNEKCHRLSDGQLQRALIARALAQETSLIILDEPTTHLDLHHKASVLKLLQHICTTTGTTILFSSHDIELILPLCDKMLVLQEKKCIMDTPEKLVENGTFSGLFPKEIIGFDPKTVRFYLKK